MTNFQASERRSPLSRERVLLALPLLVGLGVAGLMLALLVWPAGRKLRRDQLQLEQVQEQQRRLPLLRRQVVTLKQKLDEVMGKRNQILSLIAGSGEISTFMAQLDREAQASGVQLDGYEPITVAAPPPPAKSHLPERATNRRRHHRIHYWPLACRKRRCCSRPEAPAYSCWIFCGAWSGSACWWCPVT
jgi:type IV pilus assembly protein PilO